MSSFAKKLFFSFPVYTVISPSERLRCRNCHPVPPNHFPSEGIVNSRGIADEIYPHIRACDLRDRGRHLNQPALALAADLNAKKLKLLSICTCTGELPEDSSIKSWPRGGYLIERACRVGIVRFSISDGSFRIQGQ
uniref:Uncharacterized protein n=1 Tax=Parascaris univalens TaxID=6257 RepID=A0A915BPW6_PARUN